MQVALREREFYTMFVVKVPDMQQDRASNIADPIPGIGNPYPQLELDRIVPKRFQEA
jgi:hypothetical protein